MRALLTLERHVKPQMRRLLGAPVKMALSDLDNALYQQILKQATEISLNLMAIKVENRPEDFLSWCNELNRLCRDKLNFDLLEPEQLPIVKKLQSLLQKGISLNQLKMLRITPWPIFAAFIEQHQEQVALAERQALLHYLEGLHAIEPDHWNELDRLIFAGKHTAAHDPEVYGFDAEWFGSTRGARYFHQLFAERANEFFTALAEIPKQGEVERSHYAAFVKAYSNIFATDLDGQASLEKPPLFPATRLLMAWRPDQFVALTAQKVDVLCQALGCQKLANQDFDNYWDELIETLRSSAWWRQDMPESEAEQALWRNRAALVDVFFYSDMDTVSQSNYLKLKNRAANAPVRSATGGGRKRSKETAEQIVDRRLEDPSLPEYLKGRRDSLVYEVKNGKSVDQAIQLFRTIFG